MNNYGGVGKQNNLSGFIGDIRDRDRLNRAMEGVDIVVHAAALKQVQSCEYNPIETIKTNIMGSMNVIDAALDHNVEKVLAVSTDKAVSPLNLYGATKMCMEKLFINANNYRGKERKTKFCCTRYGNVADSRGTIVPIWREMIIKKETIPITNINATRFWIGMKQANEFVANVIEMMDYLNGGEIFVPNIPSVRVMDVFHALAPMANFSVIGDRIGDKLHETLISDEESKHTTKIKDIFVVYPNKPLWKYTPPEGDSVNMPLGFVSNSNRFLSENEIKKSLEENY